MLPPLRQFAFSADIYSVHLVVHPPPGGSGGAQKLGCFGVVQTAGAQTFEIDMESTGGGVVEGRR